MLIPAEPTAKAGTGIGKPALITIMAAELQVVGLQVALEQAVLGQTELSS